MLRNAASIHPPAGDIPATVRDAVLARADHLDEPARGLLELASIIPGQAEQWLLDSLLPPDPNAVDACVQSGFLLPAGEALVFRHELARMAIEGSLPPGRLETLHGKVLQALQERSRIEIPLARLIHHAIHAAEAQKVLEYCPLAAEQASQHGAHHEAVRGPQTGFY